MEINSTGQDCVLIVSIARLVNHSVSRLERHAFVSSMMVDTESLSPDILVLYGDREDLAHDLVAILASVGYNASTLPQLPSHGLQIADKFSQYAEKAKFFIAIATPDSKRRKATYPAPTVVNELAICLTNRPRDTLVLKHVRAEWPATLPQVTWEQFTDDSFHKTIAPILRSLQTSAVVSRPFLGGQADESTRELLRAFINDMDGYWDSFDSGWQYVHRQDPKVEAGPIPTLLDEFFVNYYNSLLAIAGVRVMPSGQVPDALGESLVRAEQIVLRLFTEVLDWKTGQATEEEKRLRDRQRRLPRGLVSMLQEARSHGEQFVHLRTFTQKRERFHAAMDAYGRFFLEAAR